MIGVRVADLDGDGDLDVVNGSLAGTDTFAVYDNDGTATLAPRAAYGPGVQSEVLLVDDLDGQNGPDVVAGTIDHSTSPPTFAVDIFYNNGSGGFGNVPDESFPGIATGNGGGRGTVGDFNNDGIKDLAFTEGNPFFPSSGKVVLLLGQPG